MVRDYSNAAWDRDQDIAYEYGVMHGKMEGAEDLLAEKDNRIAELENQVDELVAGGERTCKLVAKFSPEFEGVFCSECGTRHNGTYQVVHGTWTVLRDDPITRYCRYCGARIKNDVDLSFKYPHLLNTKDALGLLEGDAE